jgi:hypothetical protein
MTIGLRSRPSRGVDALHGDDRKSDHGGDDAACGDLSHGAAVLRPGDGRPRLSLPDLDISERLEVSFTPRA